MEAMGHPPRRFLQLMHRLGQDSHQNQNRIQESDVSWHDASCDVAEDEDQETQVAFLSPMNFAGLY